MGRKYSWQMRLYVIQERDKGKTWRQLEDGIKKRFGLEKPPTMRMMQKWIKETDRDKISQMMIEEGKKRIPQVGSEAISYFEQNLLPTLWSGIDAGQDFAKIGCMWMMGIAEQTFGTAVFHEAMSEYTRRRAEAKVEHAKLFASLIKNVDETQPLSEAGLEQSEEDK